MTSVAYRIEPATAERWPDVAAVMGTRGDPARCWCQYFHLRGRQWSEASPGNLREGLRTQICGSERPPGVLAYRGDEVVGWCQVGPKDSFARLGASRASKPDNDAPDPDGLWAITCFVVPIAFRGRGVAAGLLAGAAEFARDQGAQWVEGYPVDTGGARAPAANLYHGTVGQFANAGFTALRRPAAARVVMRMKVGDGDPRVAAPRVVRP
jgi:GNAT superfamily N-acetyltransferase